MTSSESARLDVVLSQLAEPAFTYKEALHQVPERPGLYAIHGSSASWRGLGLGDPPDDRPLYVGKAEASLPGRDLRQHFASGKTGSSTLRRSVAALLADGLGLVAIPRSRTGTDSAAAHYRLTDSGEVAVTDWMRSRLRIAVWVSDEKGELASLERAVLAKLQPPLNLTGVHHRYGAQVRAARKRLAAQAKENTRRL